LPVGQRAAAVRRRIEHALEQLIRLREGQFSFSLSEAIPRMVGSREITEETLPQGINPQELLLDLARGMDEDRRDSKAALEASFAEPAEDAAADALGASGSQEVAPAAEPAVAPSAAPASTEPISTVLLVDDEDEVRRIVAEHLTRAGYNVVEAHDPDA